MNKSQRRIYVELASEIDSVLCSFCKFSACASGDSPCDCGDPWCDHPLNDVLDNGHGIEPGEDCWGFRPAHPVDFVADAVGICLANGWNEWVIFQSKTGRWHITGAK